MFFKLLIVDDEALSLESTRSLLESRGFRVDTASNGDEAIEKLKSSPSQYALVILDYQMAGKDGAATSRELLSISPELYILIHSGDDSSNVIKSSWEAGAQRFIGKSEDPEYFVSKVTKWYKKFEAEHQISFSTTTSPAEIAQIESAGMVGRSTALVMIAQQTNKYAPLRESVLILGETGSGKETVAKALHQEDPASFFPVNCAAFKGDSHLMESELFGYMRGAFTGADRDKKGILELAKGGTVFLDEIQSLSPIAQEKLLRVLQLKKIRPVGAHKEFEIDFRLVVAGKPNLKEMADRNEFLPDLYERLNVLVIHVPALRERPEDIEPLVRYFCNVYSQKTGQRKIFNSRAIRYMEAYPWPRNVRQLENTVRRVCINVDAEIITEKDLEGKLDSVPVTSSLNATPLRTRVSEVERVNLISLLQRARSIREAARRANVPETTFRRRMQKHGIPFSGWNATQDSGE